MTNINNQPIRIRLFLYSGGLVFIITGAAKLWTAFSKLKILMFPDPLFSIKFGSLLLIVGIIEVVLGVVCFARKRSMVVMMAIAYFATNLLIYRIGVWGVGWKKPCSCLGNLSDALHISPQTADSMMKIILAYLLIGSYVNLFMFWRQRRK